MENAGYVALSSQMVLQNQMDVIANNIANLNTPSYKAEELVFVEYMTKTEDGTVSFVQDLATVRDVAPGPLAPTHGPLDLALPGDGYFTVETPNGTRYTRTGNFALNAAGEIVNADGHRLLGAGGGPLVLPPEATSIHVARDGTVSSEQGNVGRIQVVDFPDEQALTRLSGGLYDAGPVQPTPIADPQIVQGMIEGSNVVGVLEITRMIGTLRSYQAAQSLVEEQNQIQEQAIQRLLETTA